MIKMSKFPYFGGHFGGHFEFLRVKKKIDEIYFKYIYRLTNFYIVSYAKYAFQMNNLALYSKIFCIFVFHSPHLLMHYIGNLSPKMAQPSFTKRRFSQQPLSRLTPFFFY